jgi:hypothetical protein
VGDISSAYVKILKKSTVTKLKRRYLGCLGFENIAKPKAIDEVTSTSSDDGITQE